MPRPSSIPKDVRAALVSRWAAGSSLSDLLAWVRQQNEGREEPIQTTRSSLYRLVSGACASQSGMGRMQAIHRAQVRAPGAMETLDEVQESYRHLFAAAAKTKTDDDRKRLDQQARLLRQMELGSHRLLRLAGCAGEAADRFSLAFDGFAQDWRNNVRHQDDNIEKGLPAETGAQLFLSTAPDPGPDPTPEAEAAARKNDTRSDSITLASSPPDDGKRDERVDWFVPPGFEMTFPVEEAFTVTRYPVHTNPQGEDMHMFQVHSVPEGHIVINNVNHPREEVPAVIERLLKESAEATKGQYVTPTYRSSATAAQATQAPANASGSSTPRP